MRIESRRFLVDRQQARWNKAPGRSVHGYFGVCPQVVCVHNSERVPAEIEPSIFEGAPALAQVIRARELKNERLIKPLQKDRLSSHANRSAYDTNSEETLTCERRS